MSADEITNRLQSLSLATQDLNSTASHLIHPTHDAVGNSPVPRYLFRVYSANSAGENSKEWVKSESSLEEKQPHIFDLDAEEVAITLNEHLRWWPTSYYDIFVSWTASLVFAIQYIIYKHKKDRLGLESIHLCVVDTAMFPLGTFFQDLDLIRRFQDCVPPDREIRVKDETYGTSWACQGLRGHENLRRRKHNSHPGFYYFGEYLSQGETYIQGKSYTVSSDKVVNTLLFTLDPRFEDEMHAKQPARLADAVVSLRDPFYNVGGAKAELTVEMRLAAQAIVMKFAPAFRVAIWANLLALRRWKTLDIELGGIICAHIPDQIKQFCAEETHVFPGPSQFIPEVQKAEAIMSAIREAFSVDMESQEKAI